MAVYIPFPFQVQEIFTVVFVGPPLKICIQIQCITSITLVCTAICGRAREIIRQCTHPDYRELLSDYLARAEKEPGHIPVLSEESGSFHLRLTRSGSMKASGS
jgi:hypothetical protein